MNKDLPFEQVWLTDILITCTDNLKSFSEVITSTYKWVLENSESYEVKNLNFEQLGF